MTEHDDTRLRTRIRDELDRSVDALDELTVARLRAARRQALDASPAHRGWFLASGLATATALSGVVALLVITPASVPVATTLEPIEMITDADPDFYKELEFYQWLAERERAG